MHARGHKHFDRLERVHFSPPVVANEQRQCPSLRVEPQFRVHEHKRTQRQHEADNSNAKIGEPAVTDRLRHHCPDQKLKPKEQVVGIAQTKCECSEQADPRFTTGPVDHASTCNQPATKQANRNRPRIKQQQMGQAAVKHGVRKGKEQSPHERPFPRRTKPAGDSVKRQCRRNGCHQYGEIRRRRDTDAAGESTEQ